MDDLITPEENDRNRKRDRKKDRDLKEGQPTLLEEEEFALIQARRIKALTRGIKDQVNDPTSGDFREMIDDLEMPQHERSLIGLAISGGGIRSATFGLGVLQCLAELELLKYIDYLSTVSGGGYIGSWLAAWMKREGDCRNVAQQLIPDRSSQSKAVRGFDGMKIKLGEPKEAEPHPIFHLRQFSNYLSPRLSFFSADSWALIGIYLRNLCANQLVLLPLFFAVVLLARLMVLFFVSSHATLNFGAAQADPFGILAKILGVVCGMLLPVIALCGITLALKSVKKQIEYERRDDDSPPPFLATSKYFCRFLLPLLGLSSVGLSWLLVPGSKDAPSTWILDAVSWLMIHETAFHVSDLLRFAVLSGVAYAVIGTIDETKNRWHFLWGFVAGGVGGALLYAIRLNFLIVHKSAPHLTATLGPPLVMLAFVLAGFAELAVLGREADERQREWCARLCAWLLLIATCWAVVMGLAVFGELWLWQLGEWWQAALAAGWISSAVAGVLAARSPKTNGGKGGGWLDWVGMVMPFVFLLGLACALSSLASFILDEFDTAKQPVLENIKKLVAPSLSQKTQPTEKVRETTTIPDGAISKTTEKLTEVVRTVETPNVAEIHARQYWWNIAHTDLLKLLSWLAGAVGVSLIAAFRVDVNDFSLSAMYANRLTRCYLGASRRKTNDDPAGVLSHCHGLKRHPNEVTGFDLNDDLALFKLRIGTTQKKEDRDHDQSQIKCDADRLPYWGPFPLINTALNLVTGDELAWQERMADSFVLSPLYCGSASLGYRNTEKFAAGRGQDKPLTVGRAMAISGAAANPNMGYHSSPAATALMTIFNARLGWWLPNPKCDKSWTTTGPALGIAWLISELFGFTTRHGKYLNISDGGHFENLGVYELIRRRCRCIIVSDAGADPKFEFEDLGNLVRKCRSDLGVDIEIDVSQIQPKSGTRQCKWHCAIGTIRYDRVEETAPAGLLIYLKPSLTGEEPADIQHYAAEHADFPHEPTLDQFFSESQFESYRQLGYHCTSSALREVVEETHDRIERGAILGADRNLKKVRRAVEDHHRDVTENLVYRIRKKWLIPPDLDDKFVDSVEAFARVHRDLRDHGQLKHLTDKMYPQLAEVTKHGNEPSISRRRDEIHTACQMLQVLENAWLELKLDRFHAHPLNAGWMNLFDRWGSADLLRRYWPLLRGEFSREFVAFCERESALKVDLKEHPETLSFFDDLESKIQKRMYEEHELEWPEEKTDFFDEAEKELVAPQRSRSLRTLFRDAWKLPHDLPDPLRGRPAFWSMRLKLQPPLPPGDLEDGFVVGVIGLRPLRPDEKTTANECQAIKEAKQQIDNCKELRKEDKSKRLAEMKKRMKAVKQEIIAPKAEPAYELVLWVRPGFRQQRIGKTLVQSFFKMLWDGSDPTELGKTLGKSSKLVVYYPKRGGWSSQDKLAKAQWLSYFAFYGFRRPGANWPYSETHEVLVRNMEDLADYDDPC